MDHPSDRPDEIATDQCYVDPVTLSQHFPMTWKDAVGLNVQNYICNDLRKDIGACPLLYYYNFNPSVLSAISRSRYTIKQ